MEHLFPRSCYFLPLDPHFLLRNLNTATVQQIKIKITTQLIIAGSNMAVQTNMN